MDDGLKKIFEKWKAQGYVNYLEFRETLPTDITDQDQIDDIATMITDMGIEIRTEKAEVINLNLDENDD